MASRCWPAHGLVEGAIMTLSPSDAADCRNAESLMQAAGGLMQTTENDQAQGIHLKFVFRAEVVSSVVSANATFDDIARKLGKLSKRRYGNPLAIYATFNPGSRAAHLHRSRDPLMIVNSRNFLKESAGTAVVLTGVAVASCGPQHSSPQQVQANNPGVTYKHRSE